VVRYKGIMMDELTLVTHMAGVNGVVTNKLREKGFADLTVLLEKGPGTLATELNVDQGVAQKIITAAQAIHTGESAKPKRKKKSMKDEALLAAEQAISKAINKTPKGRPRSVRSVAPAAAARSRYGKFILPILGLVFIGVLLRNRG